jgi:ankyrin repeat protein
MVACYYGHIAAVQALIQRGADVKHECKTPDRVKELVSPVSLAANGKHLAIVKLLWDAGVPAKDKKPTLLCAAAGRGDLKEIATLIKAGADPNAKDPLTNDWPLSVAASAGQAAAVGALLKAGANANPPGCKFSPLLSAVSSLEYKKRQGKAPAAAINEIILIVQSLLAAGAKPNVSCFGISPLSLAEDMKCTPLVEVLKAALPVPLPKKTKK